MHAALALGELQAHEAAPGAGHRARRSGRKRPLPRHRGARPHRRRRIDRSARRRLPPPTISSSPLPQSTRSSKTDDARVAPLMVSLLDQELLRPAAIDNAGRDWRRGLRAGARARAQPAGSDAAARSPPRWSASTRATKTASAPAASSSRRRARVDHADGPRAADRRRRRGATTTASAAATVLGWLGHDALDALIALVGDPAVCNAAIADSIVAIGADAVAPLIGTARGCRRRPRAWRPPVCSAASAIAARRRRCMTRPRGCRRRGGRRGGRRHSAASATPARARRAVRRVRASAAPPSGAPPIAAINAIGAAGTSARAAAAIADADPRVRECAIRVAGYFGFDECVPAIVRRCAIPTRTSAAPRSSSCRCWTTSTPSGSLQSALRGRDATQSRRRRARAAPGRRSARRRGRCTTALQDPRCRGSATSPPRSLGEARFGSAAADDARAAGAARSRHARAHRRHHRARRHAWRRWRARVAAELIDDPDDDLAIAAVNVLGAIPRPDAHELLTRAARSPRPAVQLAAIRALAERPNAESVEVLSWAARLDDDPALAPEAIDALRRIAATAEHPMAQRAAVHALRELAAEGTQRLDGDRRPRALARSAGARGGVGVERRARGHARGHRRRARRDASSARLERTGARAARRRSSRFARRRSPASPSSARRPSAAIIAAMRQTDPDRRCPAPRRSGVRAPRLGRGAVVAMKSHAASRRPRDRRPTSAACAFRNARWRCCAI